MSLLNGPDLGLAAPVGSSLLNNAPPPAAPLPPDQGGPRANHMAEADAMLALTPQEKFLYNMHLMNLNGPGKIQHPDGSISSLLQMSFERDGKIYNVPTVWNGQQLPPDDAIKMAEKVGLDKFPSYNSEEEAESRYEAMHDFLGKDTTDYMQRARAAGAPRSQ